MSVAAIDVLSAPSLSDLADGLASRTGAWFLVERFGAVLSHGGGAFECPPTLAQSLLAKDTVALRSAVRWSRGQAELSGELEGHSVVAVPLGEGATAWLIGGKARELHKLVPLLSAALNDDHPPQDSYVEDLLHPRGPHRRTKAPAAQLVVLRSELAARTFARIVTGLLAGTEARVHLDGDLLVVALEPSADAGAILRQIRRKCESAVGGIGRVSEEAADWVSAARLGAASAAAAQRVGVALGDPTDPVIAAEVVLQHAQDAIGDLVSDLVDAPLERLRCHDSRTSGDLIATLGAWCREGFDTGATSAVLHVHVNTLRYRLRRAEQISGLDLGSPRQRLALQLLLTV